MMDKAIILFGMYVFNNLFIFRQVFIKHHYIQGTTFSAGDVCTHTQ